MHARKGLVLLVYILMTCLMAATLAKSYINEKRVQNPTSFKTMMRYGRAGPSYDKENKVNIRPRADAFFLGPRYGKRSSWSPNASLVYPVSGPLCALDEDLSCTYTGVSDLYRCTPRNKESGELSTSSN